MSTDSTIYRLSDPDCIKRLLACLTDQQVDAIKMFLNTCLTIGNDWLDVSEVPLALRQWNGDEAAAEELKALQASRVAAAKKLAANFSARTEDEQQQVLGLIG